MKVKKENIDDINFEEIWNCLPAKGKLDPGQKKRMWKYVNLQIMPTSRRIRYQWMSAAVVFLVAASAIVVWNLGKQEYLEVASKDSSKTILLEDSTQVILGQYSKLRYPSEFGYFNRDVILEGNAVFKVTHNGKSFTVNSGEFKTKVLGTFFKVEMSNDLKEAKISLFEGKIQVSYANARAQILKPGEQWQYKAGEGLPRLNHDSRLSDKNIKLHFKNTCLKEVLKQISVIYGIKINNKTAVNGKMRITGTFYYSSPLQSLEEMGYPFGLGAKKINEQQYEIK